MRFALFLHDFSPPAQSPFPSWLENNNASKRCQQSHCCASSFMPAAFIWSPLSSTATRDARKKWALILHQFEPSLKKYFRHQHIRSLVQSFLSFLVSYCFSLFEKKLPQMSAMIRKCFFFPPKTTRLKDVLQCQMSWKVLLTVEVVRNNLCIFVWPSVQAYRSHSERFQTAGVV